MVIVVLVGWQQWWVGGCWENAKCRMLNIYLNYKFIPQQWSDELAYLAALNVLQCQMKHGKLFFSFILFTFQVILKCYAYDVKYFFFFSSHSQHLHTDSCRNTCKFALTSRRNFFQMFRLETIGNKYVWIGEKNDQIIHEFDQVQVSRSYINIYSIESWVRHFPHRRAE